MNKKLITRLLASLGAVGLLGMPAAQAADFPGPFDGVINVADAPGLGTGSGGAFKVTIVSGLGEIKNDTYGAVGNTFLTFCLEKDEYLTLPGAGYDVNLAPSADMGGAGGPSPDPISAATAWLFKKFAAGTLTSVSGFAYDNTGGNQLQDAIWWLEQELEPALGNSPDAGYKYLVDAAMSALTIVGYDNARTTANTDASVQAMRLYNGPPSGYAYPYNQDLLTLVPEPSTYIAGGLLGLPVLLGALRRRAAKVA